MTSSHTPGPWHWDSDPIKGDPLGRVCGMTLRDYFAASAMTGILACFRDYRGADDMEKRASLAFEYADAMLKARKQ